MDLHTSAKRPFALMKPGKAVLFVRNIYLLHQLYSNRSPFFRFVAPFCMPSASCHFTPAYLFGVH